MSPRETGPSGFKARLIKNIKSSFPECVIFLTDAGYVQGAPDIIVLCRDKWAALEVKATEKSSKRPNQLWWVNQLNDMSYSSFVYPENEEVVLNDLQITFGA